MDATLDPAALAALIDRRLDELRGDAGARAAAEELVRALMQFYGAAITRLVHLAGEGAEGGALIDRLAEDPLVSSVLLLHDAHPHDAARRLAAGINAAQAMLGPNGAAVAVVEADAHRVLLRVTGAQPSAAARLQDVARRAVAEAVPDIPSIEFVEPAPAAASLLHIQRGDGTPVPLRPAERRGAPA
ncbi:MAG: hypothetical protein ABJC89_18025 [Acidobacteriota bacterium]